MSSASASRKSTPITSGGWTGRSAFASASGLSLYRITSALLPFADEPVGQHALEAFAEKARQIGERAVALGIRLVLHPDQFVVLSSDSEHVIENSLKILRMHARTMDLLGQPRSAWAAMQLHGGKSGRAERLVRVIETLPEEIRSRLALENDERAYGAREILEVCSKTGVPMVFDAHHHVIKERLDSYDHESVGEDACRGPRHLAQTRMAARPHIERADGFQRPAPS